MQRILSRGEIESLDYTTIARLRQPERTTVFSARAARLRVLAEHSPIADYLCLMAAVADAQQLALTAAYFSGASVERIDLAQTHGMPPLQAVGWPRDPAWRTLLATLLTRVAADPAASDAARVVCAHWCHVAEFEPDQIEAMADALLAERVDDIDSAIAPFLMAALQVYWTDMACRFDAQTMPVVSPFGVCPMCGSLPVASIVRVGGQADGLRYLSCGLCACEWHMVRVTCSHCENTKDLAYHSIEGHSEAIRAESCEHCHSYRKIFYQDKDLYVEPLADDLASLALDVLMGEAGYLRANRNPLLWYGENAA